MVAHFIMPEEEAPAKVNGWQPEHTLGESVTTVFRFSLTRADDGVCFVLLIAATQFCLLESNLLYCLFIVKIYFDLF